MSTTAKTAKVKLNAKTVLEELKTPPFKLLVDKK